MPQAPQRGDSELEVALFLRSNRPQAQGNEFQSPRAIRARPAEESMHQTGSRTLSNSLILSEMKPLPSGLGTREPGCSQTSNWISVSKSHGRDPDRGPWCDITCPTEDPTHP